MRRILVLVICISLFGCDKKQPYTGKCTIEKVDGQVTSVKVVLPNKSGADQTATFDMSTREDMTKLINGLESLLLDLKQARDQMPVVEPPPPKK
jgi:hypothetical protein